MFLLYRNWKRLKTIWHENIWMPVKRLAKKLWNGICYYFQPSKQSINPLNPIKRSDFHARYNIPDNIPDNIPASDTDTEHHSSASYRQPHTFVPFTMAFRLRVLSDNRLPPIFGLCWLFYYGPITREQVSNFRRQCLAHFELIKPHVLSSNWRSDCLQFVFEKEQEYPHYQRCQIFTTFFKSSTSTASFEHKVYSARTRRNSKSVNNRPIDLLLID